MSYPDDRAEFQARSIALALQLGEDKTLFEKSTDLIIEADKYKYTYIWTWLGVPIIQMPADIVALQEVVWQSKPDVIIETGVARGGSVIFLASLLELMGGGKVVGVDIDIRSHNRDTIEKHPLAKRVTLIEGSSIAEKTFEMVQNEILTDARVMVILDSNHSRDHVLTELRKYGPLVSSGHYLVVADTLLGHMTPGQTPRERSHVWLPGDEPLAAVDQFLAENQSFERDPVMNAKLIMSSSPGGYLRRKNG